MDLRAPAIPTANAQPESAAPLPASGEDASTSARGSEVLLLSAPSRRSLGEGGYDPVLALECAKASLDAYFDDCEGIWLRGPIHQTAALCRPLAPRGEPRQDWLLIAFRGSANIANWLADAECWLRPVNGAGSVHCGFMRLLNEVQNQLDSILALRPGSTPVFTGHSLGGALAMLAAARAALRFPHCYTFGQPRLFDCNFRDWYNYRAGPRTWRLVNREDIVPHLPIFSFVPPLRLSRPPARPSMGEGPRLGVNGFYRHAGNLVLFDNAGGLGINPSWLFSLRSHARGLAADLWRLAHGQTPQWAAIRQHSMSSYLSDLTPARPARQTGQPLI